MDRTISGVYLARLALLCGVYVATAKLGLWLDAISGFAAVVWPPTGIALAALLLFGYRMWPGVAVGAWLANLSAGAPAHTAACLALGNTLEALLGAYLLRRVGFRASLERVRDVLALIALAAVFSPVVSATIGVSSLWLNRILPASMYGLTWRAWWMGDMLGALIVAPTLLVWTRRAPALRQPPSTIEALLLSVSLSAVDLGIFWGLFAPVMTHPTMVYLVFPFFIWAALRFGQRGAVASVFVTSALAIWATALGFSPFAGTSLSRSLMHLQMFMGAAGVTTMILAAAVMEQAQSERRAKASEEALRRTSDDLERRVQERTDTLARANEQLRTNEERFRAVVETARDAIISADQHGRIIAWNNGAEAVFGYRSAEILGQSLTALMPPRFRQAHGHGMQRFNVTGEAHVIGKTVELVGLRQDGTEFPLELSLSTWTTSEGPFFTAIIRDITERKHTEGQLNRTNELLVAHQTELMEALVKYKQANEELRVTQLQLIQSAKLESVGRLAAGVAHEVKNPLATLLIGIDHLADHFRSRDENVTGLLHDMQRAVHKADAVIKGLLHFSAPEQLKMQPEDVHDILEQALILVKHAFDRTHVTVVKALALDLPPVRLDRSKIEQVFVNLFMNANDAMAQGGTLTIRTRIVQPPAPGRAPGRRREDAPPQTRPQVIVEVDDTGSGIPAEKVSKIFDPFFTTKPAGQGTGLGLTVSRKIVELHGGIIDACNRPNGGVRATVIFHAEGREQPWAGNAFSSSMTKSPSAVS